jgi:hypothetical protein
MVKTGRLEIDHNTGISRLNAGPSDRTRLAKDNGGGDPFANATEFLVDQRGLSDGDTIFVTGNEGTHSGVKVIFITDAGLAQDAAEVISVAEAATRSVKATKKSTTKKTKPSQKAGANPAKAGTKGGKKSGKRSRKK